MEEIDLALCMIFQHLAPGEVLPHEYEAFLGVLQDVPIVIDWWKRSSCYGGITRALAYTHSHHHDAAIPAISLGFIAMVARRVRGKLLLPWIIVRSSVLASRGKLISTLSMPQMALRRISATRSFRSITLRRPLSLLLARVASSTPG
jgi:hypothetical protein